MFLFGSSEDVFVYSSSASRARFWSIWPSQLFIRLVRLVEKVKDIVIRRSYLLRSRIVEVIRRLEALVDFLEPLEASCQQVWESSILLQTLVRASQFLFASLLLEPSIINFVDVELVLSVSGVALELAISIGRLRITSSAIVRVGRVCVVCILSTRVQDLTKFLEVLWAHINHCAFLMIT